MNSRRNFLRVLFATCLALVAWFNITPAAFADGADALPPLNQPAPEFTLPTNTGDGEVSLSDYRGQWVVLYFYPKDFTLGCTLEARRFQEDLPKYIDINTQVIGVSVDSVDSHAKFCDSEGLKFPLLADTDGAVSKTYGSWFDDYALRQTFIIDPEGIIRAEYTGVKPATHSAEVLARLNELQQTAS